MNNFKHRVLRIEPNNTAVRKCAASVCVCFLPIHSGHQIRWTYQPGSHRRKVTQDFSSTFFLRCVPRAMMLKELRNTTVDSTLCWNVFKNSTLWKTVHIEQSEYNFEWTLCLYGVCNLIHPSSNWCTCQIRSSLRSQKISDHQTQCFNFGLRRI